MKQEITHREEIFADHVGGKGLGLGRYRERRERDGQNIELENGQNVKRHFIKEAVRITNQRMKIV